MSQEMSEYTDLFDKAAEKLKYHDGSIDKTIQDLAKDVEARGVPKNKVARIVVKELTVRQILSPSRIYEGLGIEQKERSKSHTKLEEESVPQTEQNVIEVSSTGQEAVSPPPEIVKKLQDKLTEVNSRVKVLEQTRQPEPDVQVLENQLTYAHKMMEKLRLMALKPSIALDETTGIVHDSQISKPDEMMLKRFNLDLDKTNNILNGHVEEILDRNKELKKAEKQPLIIGTRILGKDKHTMIPASICIWFENPKVTVIINEARLAEIKDHS